MKYQILFSPSYFIEEKKKKHNIINLASAGFVQTVVKINTSETINPATDQKQPNPNTPTPVQTEQDMHVLFTILPSITHIQNLTEILSR